MTGGSFNITMQNGPSWNEINKDDIEITFTRKVGSGNEYETSERTYTVKQIEEKWFNGITITKILTLNYDGHGVSGSNEQLFGIPTSYKIKNITNILTESLSDLDQLREDILAKGNERFEMNLSTKLGGSTNFTYIQHILGGNNSKYESATK